VDIQEQLRSLKEKQEQLLHDYTAMMDAYQGSDLVRQNAILWQELTQTQAKMQELAAKYGQAAQENTQLRMSLKEQIWDEKLSILRVSRDKLAAYFGAVAGENSNRLTALESKARQEINELRDIASKELAEERTVFLQELDEWSESLAKRIQTQQERFHAARVQIASRINTELDAMAAGELSQAVVEKRMKQNEMELKIGLNWVNKLGILLLLFGVGAAAKYTYSTWFTNHMKGLVFFLAGGLLLLCGEWFYRKGREVFATGLLGGGISVLYCAVFYSYFLLNIITINTGLIVAILISATAVALALRYQSGTICALGLIGGYLPFFTYIYSFGLRGDGYYVAMGYLLLLNIALLLIAFYKQWKVINYVSMTLHIPSLIFLVSGAQSAAVSILYTMITFATHIGIMLADLLRHKAHLNKTNVALLGMNTFISCTVMYFLFFKAGWANYQGALALAFCLIYGGLASLVEKKIPTEKYTSLLFYVTALTFAILMIPFQFGIRWMSLGWLIQGVLLTIYGLTYKQSRLETAGWTLFAFCLAAFYLVDWLAAVPGGGRRTFFDLKYAAVVGSMLLITGAYMADMRKNGLNRYVARLRAFTLFKYFALVNLWCYLLYLGGKLSSAWLPQGYYGEFYRLVIYAAISCGMAYGLARVSLLSDRYTRYFRLALYLVSVLICVYLNIDKPLFNSAAEPAARYAALAVLVLYNVLMLVVLREMLPVILQRYDSSAEVYPLAIVLYFLGNVTVFLTGQFQLGITHLSFSLVYLFTALGSIYYGFAHKYTYIRRFGLGLALLATTKLFIFDLSFLTSLYKIAAYFSFGFALLAISYLYQRLSSKEGRGHGETR